jgi:hypothetical protein
MTLSIADVSSLAKATESDDRWFKRNPRRTCRMRRRIFGETLRWVSAAPVGSVEWTAIKRRPNGNRTRIFGSAPIGLRLPNSDKAIESVIWDWHASGKTTIASIVTDLDPHSPLAAALCRFVRGTGSSLNKEALRSETIGVVLGEMALEMEDTFGKSAVEVWA